MKKIIIVYIIIIAAVVGLYFWLRYTINQNAILENLRGDIQTLNQERDNLMIDNRALEKEKKSAEEELEILRDGKG